MTSTGVPPQDMETKSVPHGHGVVSYDETGDTIQPARVTAPTGDQGGIVGPHDEDADEDAKTH